MTIDILKTRPKKPNVEIISSYRIWLVAKGFWRTDRPFRLIADLEYMGYRRTDIGRAGVLLEMGANKVRVGIPGGYIQPSGADILGFLDMAVRAQRVARQAARLSESRAA